MTPAEYIEYIEEQMGFPETGIGQNPDHLLYCTKEQCEALAKAHAEYIAAVEKILFPQGR